MVTYTLKVIKCITDSAALQNIFKCRFSLCGGSYGDHAARKARYIILPGSTFILVEGRSDGDLYPQGNEMYY